VTDRRPDGRPTFPIFTCFVARRTPLFLRYNPVSDLQNGPLVREGDHCELSDKGRNVVRDARGRVYELDPQDDATREKHLKGRSPVFLRRGGAKIVLQDVGTYRWMVVKNYDPEARNDTKHHKFTEDGELRYNPADKNLYLVRGMYNDAEKPDGMIGRFGQWRPWAQICLDSVTVVRCTDRAGRSMEWHIDDPTVRQPD
jgi:hypothetical protein